MSAPPCPPVTRPPAPANICFEVNGNGILREPSGARFEINFRYRSWKETFDGLITYRDALNDITFESTDFTFVTAPGDVAVIFGFGTVNGERVQYLLEAADAKPDNFALRLGTGYTVSSRLTQGSIRLRHRC